MLAQHLEISVDLWDGLIVHLREKGQGIRESGAFLLGRNNSGVRQVTGFLPYEELQADALHEGHVSLSSASFSKLWAICSEHGITVVSDVHTHRFGPQQSRSDRTNPMVALAGHIGIIVPGFAQGQIRIEEIGVHIYLGNHRWESKFGINAQTMIRLVRL